MADIAISIKGLRKTYGDLEAVRGIDLEVRSGEVFALLGPNGAGKTTTVEIMEGHRARTAGDVRVLGHDPGRREQAFRKKIGIVLQETGVTRYLTVAEAVDMYRGYYPDPLSVNEILDVVGLNDKRDSLVNKLSGGQQRRLDVAVGLAGNPELLFLDEPTTGFDPSARRNAWGMIRGLASLGKTIFLTTHYMDEAQSLADQVAIINDGRIVAEGAPAALAGRDGDRTVIHFRLPEESPPLPADIGAETTAAGVLIRTPDAMRALHRLTGWAIDNNVELSELSVSRPSLEDVYLELTGEPAEATAE